MILTADQIEARFPGSITRELWTVVIPAAGRGSRLGFDRPKVLFPILGRSMILRMLDLFHPFCGHCVVVASPTGKAAIEAEAQPFLPRMGIQEEPLGMADAIRQAKGLVSTPFTAVVWGDQITLRPRTLELSLQCHERRAGAKLTLPTVIKEDPYIQFVRDDEGRLVGVLQRREGEIQASQGESDCGLFLFETHTLFELLDREAETGQARGKRTGEFNLLPLLSLFEEGPASVATVRIALPEETMGVNTPEEADQAARILLRREKP